MKFNICAIIKNENLYLREWIEYHLNIGIEHFILYDNNDPDGEIPSLVIQDYIDKGLVEVIDYRGKKTPNNFWSFQVAAYNDCIQKYKDSGNWFAFIDVDEFIYIEKYKKIQTLFDNMPYDNFDAVLLCWLNYGDNGKLYYENKPVLERFTTPLTDAATLPGSHIPLNNFIKSIIKPSDNTKYEGASSHCASNNCCNEGGVRCLTNSACTNLSVGNHSIIYIKHFYTKSLTEFLYRKVNVNLFNFSMNMYKSGNKWTEDHEKVYQNFLKNNTINQ